MTALAFSVKAVIAGSWIVFLIIVVVVLLGCVVSLFGGGNQAIVEAALMVWTGLRKMDSHRYILVADV